MDLDKETALAESIFKLEGERLNSDNLARIPDLSKEEVETVVVRTQ